MKLKNSLGSLFFLMVIFWIFLGLLVGSYAIDSLFFESQLFNYLRTENHRLMTVGILVPIFGMGALMMLAATGTNREFEKDFLSVVTESHANPQELPIDKLEKQVQTWCTSDPLFNKLYARYVGYKNTVAGLYDKISPKQAIDLNSAGRVNMFVMIMILGLLVVPFILVYTLMLHYVETEYGKTLGEVVAATRYVRPLAFYGVIIVSIVTVITAVVSYIRGMKSKVFGFVSTSMDATLGELPAPLLGKMQAEFYQSKFHVKIPNWNGIISFSIAILFYAPFVLGFLILDMRLFAFGFGMMVLAALISMINHRTETMQMQQNGLINITSKAKKATVFNISDCEEVVVQYQSNQANYAKVSSSTAALRSIGNNIITQILDSPQLIPYAIVFYRKNEKPEAFSLRYLLMNNSQPIDSHLVEFFFALQLKQAGFAFELQETDEQAGNWRAFK
jgi:hypothetical protein